MTIYLKHNIKAKSKKQKHLNSKTLKESTKKGFQFLYQNEYM